MTKSSSPHIPVLLDEVLEALSPSDGDVIIDGTFGAGGYTSAILDHADCRVVGIDRDPDAIATGEALVETYTPRLRLVQDAFGQLDEYGGDGVDGVVLDIGVSSMQLDQQSRGFSFRFDGPLDMRMAQSGKSAGDVVNEVDEAMLATILFHYGEERRSRAIARAICKRRTEHRLETTADLVDVVQSVLGSPRADRIHPATRTFQALRIYVNDELGELARGLFAAERTLRPGGRLVVVTFHSLEDRIVKRFFRMRSQLKSRGSRHLPEAASPNSIQFERSSFQIVNQRPVSPSENELAVNPRARSARLRWGIRTEAVVADGSDADAGMLKALGLPQIAAKAERR